MHGLLCFQFLQLKERYKKTYETEDNDVIKLT